MLTQYKDHLIQQGKNARTVQAYTVDVQQFVDHCKRKDIQPLHATNAQIQEFIDSLNAKPTTKKRKVASLVCLFKWAETSGQIPKTPIMEIKTPEVQRDPMIRMKEEDQQALLGSMSNDNKFIETRDRLLFSLCWHCGIKPSEALSLKLSDINFVEKKVVLCSRRGTKQVSYAAIEENLIRYLGIRRDHVGDETDILFLNKRFAPLSDRSVRRKISMYAKRAGLQSDINPMAVRHFHVASRLRAGEDVKELAKEFGPSARMINDELRSVTV